MEQMSDHQIFHLDRGFQGIGEGVTPWEAASGYPGKRRWWVSRYLNGYGLTGESAKGPSGRVRTFNSYAAAKRAADLLNLKAE